MSILILVSTLLLLAPLAFVLGAAVATARAKAARPPPRFAYSPGHYAGRPPARRSEAPRPRVPSEARH